MSPDLEGASESENVEVLTLEAGLAEPISEGREAKFRLG